MKKERRNTENTDLTDFHGFLSLSSL